jgi:hypothetical protein
MQALQNGFLHPHLAETSLPISVPESLSRQQHCYQIISACGSIVRKGSFTGGFIHISTRMLPKGERFLLRILSNDCLCHEGKFAIC